MKKEPKAKLHLLIKKKRTKNKEIKLKYATIRTMTLKTVIAFFVLALICSGFKMHTVRAAFDCLKLTTSSAQADKDYCRNELGQIEAELAELIKKQEDQKKQTGTIKGDVDYLTSQINALKKKIQARALAIAQLKVNITEKKNKIE